MDARPDDELSAALFRLILARLPGSEVALYAVAAGQLRIFSKTLAFGGPGPAAAPTPREVDARIASVLARADCARVDPAALGLAAGFCALHPVRACDGAPIGALVLCDLRRRRVGTGLAAALADAARIAAALLEAASTRAPPSEAPGRLRASGMAARTPGPAAQSAALAPETMRASGRVRACAADPARGASRRDGGRLERELTDAPSRGQLRLVYQGYVDLEAGAVSGVEALLRWRHPSRGELAPAAFIPLAEATGLILPIGDWALRAALASARRWPARLGLSVNVSALQFHQPGFVAQVEAALRDSGVAPGRLELEITETVLMRDNPATTAQLDALVARGVRIALDDFGTGYSALAYLGRLPHHRIKLDRAFVRDLGNPATRDLVAAILAVARKSGVCVTAEGVERADQLRLVRAMGFTHAQGFFTGPPVEDPITLLEDAQPAL